MSQSRPEASRNPSPLADRLDLIADCWRALLASPSDTSRAGTLLREMETFRRDVRDALPEPCCRVFDRLSSLREVWDCLSTESPEAAREVGLFCVRALEQLGDFDRIAQPLDRVVGPVLEESSAAWGDYLLLIEPLGSLSEEVLPPEEEVPGIEEYDSNIDAQALLRLFGAAERSELEGVPEEGSEPSIQTIDGRDNPPAELKASPQSSPVRLPERDSLEIPALPERIDLDDEIREVFLADAIELSERLQGLVLGLAQGGDPAELRRVLHTLKGAAGCIGLKDLSCLIHALEERLEAENPEISQGLTDKMHAMLDYLEGTVRILQRKASSPAERPTATLPPLASPAIERCPLTEGSPCAGAEPEAVDEGPIRVPSARFDELMDLVSELLVRRRLWSAQIAAMKSISDMVRSFRGRMLHSLDRLHEAGLTHEDRARRLAPRSDLPGQMRRLEELADDLGVLAESARAASIPLVDDGDALARLSIQLWEDLQALRVVTVRGLFQRLARVAHEAARVEDRRLEVVMAGEETGVDRALQEKAFEPLMHVVRNAVGHGIEAPGDRTRSGKAAMGRISLEARREGNTLVLSVADDGRGLDLRAIEAKARKVGLLGKDERPSDERLRSLIFHPGFSTRATANAISGRGVGMDVVAREVGALKGTLELATGSGRGTRLTIRLPARLALETAMIVRVDGQAFALPVGQIEHVQMTMGEEEVAAVAPGVESIGPGRVRFRDQSIPVLAAREILGLGDTPAPAWPKLLVVRHGGGLVGLAVDAIEGTEDLVIKSLGNLLAGHPLISGTSLSISGEVISILDPSRLYRWIGGEVPRVSPAMTTAAREHGSRKPPSVLVVDDSISVRKVLARGLQAIGLDVDEVTDGLEALGRLRGRAYDVVVTDLEMPRLDGFGLVAEMQRNEEMARIPVIVASTRSDEESERRALALGASRFLVKPVAPEKLAEAILPLIARARGRAPEVGSEVVP